MLSLAGLYELWPDPDKAEDDPGRWLWTAVIITTDATGPLGEVHDLEMRRFPRRQPAR